MYICRIKTTPDPYRHSVAVVLPGRIPPGRPDIPAGLGSRLAQRADTDDGLPVGRMAAAPSRLSVPHRRCADGRGHGIHAEEHRRAGGVRRPQGGGHRPLRQGVEMHAPVQGADRDGRGHRAARAQVGGAAEPRRALLPERTQQAVPQGTGCCTSRRPRSRTIRSGACTGRRT